MSRHGGVTLVCCGAAAAVALALASCSAPVGRPDGHEVPAVPQAVVVTERLAEEDGSSMTPQTTDGFVLSDTSSGLSGSTVSDAIALPEDVRYEAGYALVRVEEGVSQEELASLMERSATVEGVEGWVDDGLAKVRVSPGTSVEDALGELATSGLVAYAQPNYQLIPLLGDASDLMAELADALEPDLPEAPQATGGDALATVGFAEEEVFESADDAPHDDPNAGETGEQPNELPLPEGELTSDDDTSASDQTPATLQEALAATVDDPRAPEQWALASIRAYEAWSLARCDGRVTVAVIDVGFDLSHEDLAANVVDAYDAASGEPGGGTPSAHGTHVAGIVSAVADNGVGVAGVSHNARVMPLAVASANGNIYIDSVIRAYDHALARADELNLRVVNLSLGGTTKVYDQALIDKIDEARAAGVVTVAAAGNSELAAVPYEEYPGDHAGVVSVINLRQDGGGVARASGSNYNVAGQGCAEVGEGKNVCAPGTSILGTRPGGSYGYSSGTSMAAPHVAGVLALEFAANPALTADEAVAVLYASAADLGDAGWDEEYGHGEVDAAEAVRLALQAAGEPDEPTEPGEPEEPDGPEEPDEPGSPEVPDAPETSGETDGETGPTAPSQGDRAPEEVGSVPALPDASGDVETSVEEVPGQLHVLSSPATVTPEAGVTGMGRTSHARLSLVGDLPQGMAAWYRVHLQNRGWTPWVRCGADAPVGDKDVQVEAVELMVARDAGWWPASSAAGLLANAVEARPHLRGQGWRLSAPGEGHAADEATLVLHVGDRTRLAQVRVGEGIQVNTGPGAPLDAWYRACDADVGWLGWATGGSVAAATRDLLALQALLIPAGSPSPESLACAYLRP